MTQATDAIYRKHMAALTALDSTWIDLTTFRYALRLALNECAQAHQPAADIAEEHSYLDGVVRRVEAAIEKHDSKMYADLVEGEIELPTAIDGLLQQQRSLITRLTQDYHEVNAQLVALDADNARLAQELRILRSYAVAKPDADNNGEVWTVAEMMEATAPGKTRTVAEMLEVTGAANGAPSSPWAQPGMLDLLSPEVRDYWHGIDAGRWTWRKLPKSVRLAMVRHVLSFGPDPGDMTQAQFDAIKPDWMPPGSAHPGAFGVSWSQLNDERVEVAV